ncbi:MAG: hypothetical protein IKY17_06715 [Oscillospiraceae bacterium]|nr:hypothetical protein [Oscillospiraceae bacterium]
MVLNLGETKSFKLPLMLKAMDFIYEGNGLRLERQRGGVLCLNVNSGRRKDAFAAIPLGPAKELNAVGMNVKVHSNSRILFWVGNVRFVIDYNAKKVATNLLGLRIFGSKQWGENVQMPWRGEFQTLFGLPKPAAEMDRGTAQLFWQWFNNHEVEIISLVNGTKKEAKAVYHTITLWMAPVFPYTKVNELDFELKCADGDNTFIFRHGGHEKLMAEAEEFHSLMPENMAKRWTFISEE